MLFVYRDHEIIFGASHELPLLRDVAVGLSKIAHAFYDDELTCFEKENFAATALFTKTQVTFLWTGKRFKNMRRVYAAYAAAMLYADISLFEKFVNAK
jgi:hypothetical protein